MTIDEIRILFQYNYWANGVILKSAGLLAPASYTATAPVSFGSLRGTLVHILMAETIWRARCQPEKLPAGPVTEQTLPTLEALAQRWLTEERAMLAYLSGLATADLGIPIHYLTSKGVPYDTPLWQILLHVANHGTQFRSEAAVLLTQAGHSPGDLDFIYFIRQQLTA